MIKSSLKGVYQNLPTPTTGLSGMQIANYPHHLAVDAERHPILLIAVKETTSSATSLLFRHICVEHGVLCRVACPSGTVSEDRYSVVRLSSKEDVLREYFFDVAPVFIKILSREPTAIQVNNTVQRLASLFDSLERPPVKKIQGLWGELFIILVSRDPVGMIRAWHGETCERYDFSEAFQRIEVKTASNRLRRHSFSLEQIRPAGNLEIIVCSLFVEQETGGTTLGELWDQTRDIASEDAELILKVDKLCAEAVGSSLNEARRAAFSLELANSSIRFYDSTAIPQLREELPAGVSEVRFTSDLGLCSTVLKRQDLRGPLQDRIQNLLLS